MLSSFDELVLKCIDETARVHIRDAVKCYEASAYRAAIVTSYVAVCFDLIEKLKSLASANDPEAKNAATKLSNLQTQYDNNDPRAVFGLLEFERGLLELFRDKFDFFGQIEFEELSRLRADRNRCAHPTFGQSALPYKPSAELARLHISSSISLVLSQTPRQGKAALDSLQATILSAYFPTKLEDAVEQLKATEVGNPRPSLVNALVDQLAFGLADKTDRYYNQAGARLALEALVEINRASALPRLVVAVNKLLKSGDDISITSGAVLALRIPEVGEEVDDGGKSVIKEFLNAPKSVGRANAVARADKIRWLQLIATDIASTLSSEEISKLMVPPPQSIIARAAELYGNARNWDEANQYAAECGIPFADKFGADQLEFIFNSAMKGEADLLGSHGFSEFIKTLFNKSPLGALELKKLLKSYNLEAYAP
jgi:hypothetical protein